MKVQLSNDDRLQGPQEIPYEGTSYRLSLSHSELIVIILFQAAWAVYQKDFLLPSALIHGVSSQQLPKAVSTNEPLSATQTSRALETSFYAPLN